MNQAERLIELNSSSFYHQSQISHWIGTRSVYTGNASLIQNKQLEIKKIKMNIIWVRPMLMKSGWSFVNDCWITAPTATSCIYLWSLASEWHHFSATMWETVDSSMLICSEWCVLNSSVLMLQRGCDQCEAYMCRYAASRVKVKTVSGHVVFGVTFCEPRCEEAVLRSWVRHQTAEKPGTEQQWRQRESTATVCTHPGGVFIGVCVCV